MNNTNINHNKRDRGTSIRAVLLILALVTSIALPTLRPPVSHAQASGTVVGWGFNEDGQATPPAGLSGVVAISAGGEHSLALVSAFDLEDLIALATSITASRTACSLNSTPPRQLLQPETLRRPATTWAPLSMNVRHSRAINSAWNRPTN
jgi:hypothetical protein